MADAKITALTENTTPLPTDVGVIVDDPAGTPLTQKVTLANQLKGGYSITTTTTSSAPAPTGNYFRNELRVTALTENATIASPSGTPEDGNFLMSTIVASGGTRTIGYNAVFDAGAFTLETSLLTGETLIQLFRYDGTSWVCIGQTKY